MMKAQKRKRCKNPSCNKLFPIFNSLEMVCSIRCAIEWGEIKPGKEHVRKAKKRQNRARRLELKTLGEWKADVQKVFNKFIRTRDADKPCISCGRDNPPWYPRKGQWDAGHFRTVGAAPELRFEEDNCHKECIHDNMHNAEHLIGYRQNLIKRIGVARVEWLEGPHEPKHYTIDDCKDLIAQYRLMTKELEND